MDEGDIWSGSRSVVDLLCDVAAPGKSDFAQLQLQQQGALHTILSFFLFLF